MKIFSREFSLMEKLLIALLVLILLALVYYQFVDKTVRSTIVNAESEAQMLEKEIAAVQQRAMKLRSLQDTLEEMEAEHAENGQKAVQMFSDSEPRYYDTILMDVRMPIMDGLTATRNIRALERPDAKTIPIIAMTANVFDEDVEHSLQAGMNAHLSKPIEPERLYETMARLIQSAEEAKA